VNVRRAAACAAGAAPHAAGAVSARH